MLYSELGQPEEAEQRFAAAAQLAPDDPEAHQNLGRHLAIAKKYEQAIPVLERALELEDSAQTHAMLGTSFANLSRWAEAEASFRQAATLEPEDEETLRGLGICIMRQGRLADAIEVFERKIKLNADDPEISQLLLELNEAVSDADG